MACSIMIVAPTCKPSLREFGSWIEVIEVRLEWGESIRIGHDEGLQ